MAIGSQAGGGLSLLKGGVLGVKVGWFWNEVKGLVIIVEEGGGGGGKWVQKG